MRISIVCSSGRHPIFPRLEAWKVGKQKNHDVNLVENVKDLSGGDLLFLISCGELVSLETRNLFKSTLVIHASNLPEGRGWSPHVWQVLEGKNRISVTLLEAEDKVDSGAVWSQVEFELEGHELFGEINHKLFDAELELMDFAVANFDKITSMPQPEGEGSYYDKRTPEDSEIDVNRTLLENFNQLRVADSERFPAFFYHLGHKYIIRLEKDEQHD
jgi:methionyl-tRNA formyltransferase